MEPIILNTSEVLTLTDDELLRLCATNRNLRIERDRHGNLILMSPSGSNTSRKNSILILQLGIWNSRVDSFDDVLSGEDVLPGFTLTLKALRL